MKHRIALTTAGLLTLALAGCPQPVDNADNRGGSGGSAAGSGGSGGSGGSPGNGGNGGSAGSGGASAGSGGSGGNAAGAGGAAGNAAGSGGAGGSMGGAGGAGGNGAPDAGEPAIKFEVVYDEILNPSCGPMCHVTTNAGGLPMPDVDTAYTNLVDKDSPGCDGQKLVVPGDPEASVLSKIIKGGIDGCAMRPNRMPKERPALDEEEIMLIDEWIMDGAVK